MTELLILCLSFFLFVVLGGNLIARGFKALGWDPVGKWFVSEDTEAGK